MEIFTFPLAHGVNAYRGMIRWHRSTEHLSVKYFTKRRGRCGSFGITPVLFFAFALTGAVVAKFFSAAAKTKSSKCGQRNLPSRCQLPAAEFAQFMI